MPWSRSLNTLECALVFTPTICHCRLLEAWRESAADLGGMQLAIRLETNHWIRSDRAFTSVGIRSRARVCRLPAPVPARFDLSMGVARTWIPSPALTVSGWCSSRFEVAIHSRDDVEHAWEQ